MKIVINQYAVSWELSTKKIDCGELEQKELFLTHGRAAKCVSKWDYGWLNCLVMNVLVFLYLSKIYHIYNEDGLVCLNSGR